MHPCLEVPGERAAPKSGWGKKEDDLRSRKQGTHIKEGQRALRSQRGDAGHPEQCGRILSTASLAQSRETKDSNQKTKPGASLVAQWLRICLPMQGTRVRALV